MAKKPRPVKVHPLMRQAIRSKWTREAVNAQIHAALGGDKEKLLAYGSVLFFVASACAMAKHWTGDEPDMRIVRASVNALDDLKDSPGIPELARASISSGMQAAVRVLDVMEPELIDDAAWVYAQQSKAWSSKSQ